LAYLRCSTEVSVSLMRNAPRPTGISLKETVLRVQRMWRADLLSRQERYFALASIASGVRPTRSRLDGIRGSGHCRVRSTGSASRTKTRTGATPTAHIYE